MSRHGIPSPIIAASERAQRVLDLLAKRGPLTQAQIAARVGMSKTAVIRVLADVKDRVQVDRSELPWRYALAESQAMQVAERSDPNGRH